MDWLPNIRLANLSQLMAIDLPKLDHAVVSTRHKDISTIIVKTENVFDWCIMLPDNLRA